MLCPAPPQGAVFQQLHTTASSSFLRSKLVSSKPRLPLWQSCYVPSGWLHRGADIVVDGSEPNRRHPVAQTPNRRQNQQRTFAANGSTAETTKAESPDIASRQMGTCQSAGH